MASTGNGRPRESTGWVAARDGRADVVYVLVLMQVAFLLLAALGEMLLMGGSPAYLAVPAVKCVVLLVLATGVVGGRRWAEIAMIVVQGVTLAGFWLQLGLSLLPVVDTTVNLVGLITNLGMPLVILWHCAGLLHLRRQVRLAPARPVLLPHPPAWPAPDGYPPAQDPYPSATLVLDGEVRP